VRPGLVERGLLGVAGAGGCCRTKLCTFVHAEDKWPELLQGSLTLVNGCGLAGRCVAVLWLADLFVLGMWHYSTILSHTPTPHSYVIRSLYSHRIREEQQLHRHKQAHQLIHQQ
jgi:hypothetical protein